MTEVLNPLIRAERAIEGPSKSYGWPLPSSDGPLPHQRKGHPMRERTGHPGPLTTHPLDFRCRVGLYSAQRCRVGSSTSYLEVQGMQGMQGRMSMALEVVWGCGCLSCRLKPSTSCGLECCQGGMLPTHLGNGQSTCSGTNEAVRSLVLQRPKHVQRH
jgi:hypothetical protein